MRHGRSVNSRVERGEFLAENIRPSNGLSHIHLALQPSTATGLETSFARFHRRGSAHRHPFGFLRVAPKDRPD